MTKPLIIYLTVSILFGIISLIGLNYLRKIVKLLERKDNEK